MTWPRLYVVLLLITISGPAHAAETEAGILLDSASRQFERQQIDEAIALFETVAENRNYRNSDRFAAYAGWVKSVVFKGNYDHAAGIISKTDTFLKSRAYRPDEAATVRYEHARGEYYRQTGNYDKALETHLKARQRAYALTSPDTALLALSDIYVAATYEKMSQFQPALEYGEKGYALSRSLYGDRNLKMVTPSSIMAVVYYRMSLYDSAFVYYDRAIGILNEHLEEPSTQLALLYGNQGASYNDIGEYEKALGLLEKALAINRKLDAKEGVGYNLFGIGSSYFFLGDYGRAVEYMKACLAVRNKIYPDGHYLRSSPKEIIGIAQYDMGYYKEGLENLNHVLNVRKKSFGEKSLPVGYTIENIAISLNDVGQVDSALAYMEKAMAIYEQVLPENHTNLAHSFFNLSTFYLESGKPEQALASVQRAISIYNALGAFNNLYQAQNYVMLGTIQAELGEEEEASESFEKAFAILGGDPLDEQTSLQVDPATLDALNAYLAFRFGQNARSEIPGFDKEFEHITRLIYETSDHLRRQFNDPYTKAVMMRKGARAGKEGVSMNYHLFKKSGNPAYLESLFQRAEFSRANLFRDMVDDYKVKAFAGIPDSLLREERELKQSMAEYNQQLLDDPQNDTVRQQLFETKELYNDFIKELQDKFPKYHNLKYKSAILPIGQVQKKFLKRDDAILEFMVGDTAYYGLLITKGGAEVAYAGNAAAVNQAIDGWKRAIRKLDEPLTLKYGELLYRALIAPFETHLKGENLIIVPAGPLFHVSFEALNESEDPKSRLIYRYNISYALSVNTLMEQTSSDWRTNRKPVVIAPGFEPELKSSYLSGLPEGAQPDSSYLTALRQPWSVQMAAKIARMFRGTALLDKDATERSVKTEIGNRNVVHFATHAIANHSDPLRSRFLLAKSPEDSDDDGYLHAYEIYDLSLHSELTVLTACESGQGKHQEGEGMISLAYSIHYAGCPSVVMSLWKIDEKINNQIVFDFYKFLDVGMDKSAALRKAKLKYIRSAEGRMAHPFYWSGLVVMGDPGPVQIDAVRKEWWKWAMILAVFLLIPYAVWLRVYRKTRIEPR